MWSMWRKILALSLALALPASASAGPLREAAEMAGRELGSVQADANTRSRARLWTGIALIAGGGALAVFGGIELGDSESGTADDDDTDDAAGAAESDTWEKVMLGGGIAAGAVGAILLLTGRKGSGPVVSTRSGRVTLSQTVRF